MQAMRSRQALSVVALEQMQAPTAATQSASPSRGSTTRRSFPDCPLRWSFSRKNLRLTVIPDTKVQETTGLTLTCLQVRECKRGGAATSGAAQDASDGFHRIERGM